MSKYRHAKGPSASKILIIALITLLAIALVVGAVFAITALLPSNEDVQETFATKAPTKPTATEVPTEPHTEDPQLKYSTLAQDYMKNMTNDEKIYQLLMVTPETLTGVDVATAAGDTTKQVLSEKNVGGIYYSAQNFEDQKQTMDMISNTKSYAKHPLFIAINEEGGENAPLYSKLDTTKVDPTAEHTDNGDSKATSDANTIATDIGKFGFNLNLAPTANLDENNPYMKTADIAKDHVADGMKAYQSKFVIPTLKTFPVTQDSSKSYEEMKESDFVPFITAISEGADAIMVGANMVNTIDSEFPAFMSNRIVTEVLIKELNFNGLIISPMLTDATITDKYTTDDIVTKAINAGVNMFMCPDDVDAYVTAIKTALDKQLITQQQIDESVTKILALKFKYGIIEEPESDVTSTETQTVTEVSSETSTQAPTVETQAQ